MIIYCFISERYSNTVMVSQLSENGDLFKYETIYSRAKDTATNEQSKSFLARQLKLDPIDITLLWMPQPYSDRECRQAMEAYEKNYYCSFNGRATD